MGLDLQLCAVTPAGYAWWMLWTFQPTQGREDLASPLQSLSSALLQPERPPPAREPEPKQGNKMSQLCLVSSGIRSCFSGMKSYFLYALGRPCPTTTSSLHFLSLGISGWPRRTCLPLQRWGMKNCLEWTSPLWAALQRLLKLWFCMNFPKSERCLSYCSIPRPSGGFGMCSISTQ